MRRTFLLLAILATFFASVVPAWAGGSVGTGVIYDCSVCHNPLGGDKGPHGGYTSATHVCSTCHWTVHAAGGGKLLFMDSTTQVCRTCHDGSGGLGIYTLTSNGITAGAAHRIEATSVVPGGDPSSGGSAVTTFTGLGGRLGCEDCHSPHDSNTVTPYTHDFATYTAPTHNLTSGLLKRKPTGATTSVAEYGSDWCLACHKGRLSGGAIHNHPVDSTLTTATPITFESVAYSGPTVVTPLTMSSDQASIYVADVGNHRICQFTTGGAFVRSWPTLANGQVTALTLCGDANADGQRDLGSHDILETDMLHYQIRYWKQDGTYISGTNIGYGAFASYANNRAGTADALVSLVNYLKVGNNSQPMSSDIGRGDGIAIDATNRGFVADSLWNRVSVFDGNTVYLNRLNAWPAGATPRPASGADGSFNKPMAIALAPGGNVYVADTGNDRVQYFTSAGAFLGKWGTTGSAAGQFKKPTGIFVADDGTVWVADSGNGRVQHFSAVGAYLGSFGSPGAGPGQLALMYSVRGTLAWSNGGFLMNDPRIPAQAGHGPICQQCHEDARDPGTLTASGEASPTAWSGLNPRWGCFPHETVNDNLLVRTSDGLCLDCHLASNLP